MGARRWSVGENDELLFLFPLGKGVPPFGPKSEKYEKKWGRNVKAQRHQWHKLENGTGGGTLSCPTSPTVNLTNLVDGLTEIRDYLKCAVEELEKLLG